MTRSDIETIANALLSERRLKRSALNRSSLPKLTGLAEAVDIARLCLEGAAPVAWKLGGTTQSTRQTFGVAVPYFGPLKATEVHTSGSSVFKSEMIIPVVEPEIVIALNRDIEPISNPLSTEAVLELIDWVSIGLELPDNCLGNPAEAGVQWLVADRCAAGALVVADPMAPNCLSELEAGDVKLQFGDKVVSNASAGNIIGGVLSAFSEALEQFAVYGITLKKSQLFATGGLCPAAPLPETACEVSATIGNRTVSFDWS